MTDSKHTPTPWKTIPRANGSLDILGGEIGYWLATATEHNAAHIVRCVNAHAALVDALRGLMVPSGCVDGCGHSNDYPHLLACDTARAALALAEGEGS